MYFELSAEAADAMLEALTVKLTGGEIRFYDLTRPSTPHAKLSVQRHLATVEITDAHLRDGQLITALRDAIAIASGKVTWGRVYGEDGGTFGDLDVGEDGEGCACTFNTAEIRKGGPVVVRELALGISRR